MIPDETVAALRSVVARADAELARADRERWTARAKSLLPDAAAAADLELPARRLAPVGDEVVARHGAAGRSAFAAAFVAELALERAAALPSSGLPQSVLALYPPTFARLAKYLTSADLAHYWIGDDPFLKDLRIASGLSLPCGAQDVDLVAAVSPGSAVKSMVLHRAFASGWRALTTGGPPWYRIHTDGRFLDDFNEAGWDRCYVRIADLLRRDPRVKGIVGTSWFYDPQILKVSPRLAYLQVRPLQNGAFMLPHGPGAIHTERATSKSETRKKLYEAGEYLPVCCSIVWPRAALVAWADSASPRVQ